MAGSQVPFFVTTAPALSNNSRPASTSYVDSAIAVSYNYLKPYFGDTPPSSTAGYSYWMNTQDGQLYVYYQSAWMTTANFSGGNGYVTSTGGTMQNGTISGGTIDNTVIGGTTPAAASVTSMNGGPLAGFRNRIINGAFNLNQRGITSAYSVATGYIHDRWVISGGAVYATFQTASSNLPSGASTALLVTSSAATTIAAATNCNLQQRIEGINVADLAWGTSSAKTITISFTVIASIAGLYNICVRNGGSSRSYLTTYSIPTANVLTNISVTLPGDTIGTWTNTVGSIGLYVSFNLGTGSTYSSSTLNSWQSGSYIVSPGTVNLITTSGATWQITNVQVEQGIVATPFEIRPYGIELTLCQRYYQVSGLVCTGYSAASSQAQTTNILSVPMMTLPTMVFLSQNNGGCVASFALVVPTNTYYYINGAANSSGGYWAISSTISASAEL